MLIHCCRDVFTAPLHRNDGGADHRKYRSSLVMRVGFRGNVFLSRCLAMNYFDFQASYHNKNQGQVNMQNLF
jgi:hypothetical protein